MGPPMVAVSANGGVVFKLDKSGHETVLHTFERGPVGNQPYLAGVILDPDYNLYGTTAFVAAGGAGAVYKLDRPVTRPSSMPSPASPVASTPTTRVSPSDQTAAFTALLFMAGATAPAVLYQLDGNGCETVLYTFDLFTANGYGQPTGNVIRDSAGNFYGSHFHRPGGRGLRVWRGVQGEYVWPCNRAAQLHEWGRWR